MPVWFDDHWFVASSNQQALYTIGNDNTQFNKNIYKFSCSGSIDNCAWTLMKTKLRYGRNFPIAFSIPDDLAIKLCK